MKVERAFAAADNVGLTQTGEQLVRRGKLYQRQHRRADSLDHVTITSGSAGDIIFPGQTSSLFIKSSECYARVVNFENVYVRGVSSQKFVGRRQMQRVEGMWNIYQTALFFYERDGFFGSQPLGNLLGKVKADYFAFPGFYFLANDDLNVFGGQPGNLKSAGDGVVVGNGDCFESRLLAAGQQLFRSCGAVTGKICRHMQSRENCVAGAGRFNGATRGPGSPAPPVRFLIGLFDLRGDVFPGISDSPARRGCSQRAPLPAFLEQIDQ